MNCKLFTLVQIIWIKNFFHGSWRLLTGLDHYFDWCGPWAVENLSAIYYRVCNLITTKFAKSQMENQIYSEILGKKFIKPKKKKSPVKKSGTYYNIIHFMNKHILYTVCTFISFVNYNFWIERYFNYIQWQTKFLSDSWITNRNKTLKSVYHVLLKT